MPARILVIDDTLINRQLTMATLSSAGFDVTGASDGPTGLSIAMSQPPNLILLDVRMPGMDGFAVCRELKTCPATVNIPVMFITGADDKEAEATAFDAGAVDYITKPIRPQLLLARVRTQIALYAQRRSLEGQFRDVVEFAPVAFLIANPDLNIVQVNALAVREFRFERQDMIGMSLTSLIHNSEASMQHCNATLHLDNPVFFDGSTELECTRHDGTTFWGDVTFSRLNTLKGNLYVAVVQNSTERRRMLSDLQHTQQRLRALATKSEATREEERKHIAREVHDELGQVLTALRMDLGIVRIQFGSQVPELTRKLEGMRDLVDRAIFDVRNIATNLRPAAMDLGLLPAIEWLRDEFVRLTGVPCKLNVKHDNITLDEMRAMVVYRIVQESLTNITKYARAQHVDIAIQQLDRQIELRVMDDGVGFKVNAKRKSFGLLGMEERAIALNGTFTLQSDLGYGTVIVVSFPSDDQDIEP